MKIQPRGKYVLVERDKAGGRVSANGIVSAAASEQEEKAYGTVISFGPEVTDLKKGDRVVYGAYSGEEIELEEKGGKKVKYRLLEDEFVIAFIKEK